MFIYKIFNPSYKKSFFLRVSCSTDKMYSYILQKSSRTQQQLTVPKYTFSHAFT